MFRLRHLSILSGRPAAAPRSPGAQHVVSQKSHRSRSRGTWFDACHVGVVLRTMLLVEATVAVVTLFTARTPAEWLLLTATATGGAVPGTLLWLAAACALKRRLAPWRPRWQYLAGMLLGSAAAVYGCALLRLTSVLDDAADARTALWLASAMAGAMLAALVMVALALHARARAPAAMAARIGELQARIRPHFLFNTLNSAIALVREEPARAEALLEDLSELFRQALAEPRESVPLSDEIALAKRYLAIEQVRFGDRLRVHWTIDAAANGARLPPLLLQPLVENAVRHGVEPSPDGASIRIRTQRRGSMVVIEVVNSLPALRWVKQPLQRGHGIALNNARDRLLLMHDRQGRFHAGVVAGSYRVRIDLPAASP